MKDIGLTAGQLAAVNAVFRLRPNVRTVWLYGSRAKGTFRPESDIDLAVAGITDELEAEAIAEELDALPMPYRFDVKSYDAIQYPPLLAHIDRVGVVLFSRREDAAIRANMEALGYGG